MADNTAIEWADATWNPVTGCSVVSPGCTNCYAMRLTGGRLRHHPTRVGLTEDSAAGPVWNGIVRLNEGMLDQPLRWRRPRRIFVCAHGDLFHEAVPDDWIDRVCAVMALCPQHTFQVLTKRAERMRRYMADEPVHSAPGRAGRYLHAILEARHGNAFSLWQAQDRLINWPLPNVWLGVSADDQRRADERIPDLLATPAEVHFVSAEPLLEEIYITRYLRRMVVRPYEELTDRMVDEGWSHSGGQGDHPVLSWVIVGGESGPRARPMHLDWVRSIQDQCSAADVSFFFKQWGEWLDADEKYRRMRGQETNTKADSAPKFTQPLNYSDAARLAQGCGASFEHHSDGSTLIRVGKHAAGRLLDGREWNEYPR
jgi:protein gp37